MNRPRLRIAAALALVAATLGASTAIAEEPPEAAPPGEIRGQVYDGATGTPLAGVAIRLIWPDPGDGSAAREDKATSAVDGEFVYRAVPRGTYRLRFAREGYRDSELDDFRVEPGRENRADFPLPPRPLPNTRADSSDIEVMVVEASAVDDIMAGLDLRMQSDQLLNVMGAEEFAKFAAGDVADALKRVSGVNVVGGQFAIIRGLEDRYSSTTFNGAPVPSPDPDKQSVQLDLFVSDIVSSVQVAKSFAASQPSNSAGGSIDILTYDYPGEFQFKINLGGGVNENAADRFLLLSKGSPVGREKQGSDVLKSDIGGSFGGRFEAFAREFRYRGVFNREVDFETASGLREKREPAKGAIRQSTGIATANGDLAFGRLSLSGGLFDYTESKRSEQWTGFGAFGLDLDAGAAHRVDFTAFYTRKTEGTVLLLENGFIPGVDYAALRQRHLDDLADNGVIDSPIAASDFDCCATDDAPPTRIREDALQTPVFGGLWFTNFAQSQSFDRARELLLFQLNGDHRIKSIPGLSATWVANHATTKELGDDFGARPFFEPDEKFIPPINLPARLADLGPGNFAVRGPGLFLSTSDVNEDQWFARADAKYESALTSFARLQIDSGGWYERATREVESEFLETPFVGTSTQFAIQAPTLSDLGSAILDTLTRDASGRLVGLRPNNSDASREVLAWAIQAKATLFDDLDVVGGVRLERNQIETRNNPFTGGTSFDNTPTIFPSKYLFLDRLDNAARGETTPPRGTTVTFNDQILGIPVPIDPVTGFVDLKSREEIQAAVNGSIDEILILPQVGLTYRPIAGLNLRGAFSKSAARPSFRELGYYVTVRPGVDELIVGNPKLQLSPVLSGDLRSEYTWGDFGDLAALSVFYKEIDRPIEAFILRDPANIEAEASFRTYRNNPNQAKMIGIELEARKNLEFLGLDFLEFFTIGANATYIHARVERNETELERSREFFADVPPIDATFPRLLKRRRLYGQPEWIANGDLTFDQEDWGTKITLSAFAISSVLDAAGSGATSPRGTVTQLKLDRYIDTYYQLDLVASQTWYVPLLRGDLTAKVSIKNLSDSTRRWVYDREQTAERVSERSYKVGRRYSFSLGYTF